MASNALEARISKIRQQNEEIRRRHEEVEEDKKNAAKLNALVQMTSSMDWPVRKEPPDFGNNVESHQPSKAVQKQKFNKEHSEHFYEHAGGGDMKKTHTFAQGEGPPPDPKYNFLADSEREESNTDDLKGNSGTKLRNKTLRNNFKKKKEGSGRDGLHKDNRPFYGTHRNDYQPEYEAWRAERNRIDEDRISRQRTAEGSWRREWDNDKAHVVDKSVKREARATTGSFVTKENKDFDRRYHSNSNDHLNHNRATSHRPHQGVAKNYQPTYNSNTYNNTYEQYAGPSERTVIATDKNIKVMLNQTNATKGPVMSVKVSTPSIAGTGRVGPRQRTRVTYSSNSDVELCGQDNSSFQRQKSFEDKSKSVYGSNIQKSPSLRRPHQQKKNENEEQSPHSIKKEFKKDEFRQKSYYTSKPQKVYKKVIKFSKNECEQSTTNEMENIVEHTNTDILENSDLAMTKDNQIDGSNKETDNRDGTPVTINTNNSDIQIAVSNANPIQEEVTKITESVEGIVDYKIIPEYCISNAIISNKESNIIINEDVLTQNVPSIQDNPIIKPDYLHDPPGQFDSETIEDTDKLEQELLDSYNQANVEDKNIIESYISENCDCDRDNLTSDILGEKTIGKVLENHTVEIGMKTSFICHLNKEDGDNEMLMQSDSVLVISNDNVNIMAQDNGSEIERNNSEKKEIGGAEYQKQKQDCNDNVSKDVQEESVDNGSEFQKGNNCKVIIVNEKNCQNENTESSVETANN